MIPRRFLRGLDLLTLVVAFSGAYWLVPRIQPRVLSVGPSRFPRIAEALSLPSFGGVDPLPAMSDLLWVLIPMATCVMLVLEQLGGYWPIAKQSRTRVVLTSIVAPLIGVSVIVLLVFATKGAAWSRLFTFSYAALAMAGLGAYRMSARWYCRSRIAAGFHAKGVVLVGEPPAPDPTGGEGAPHPRMA